MLENILVINDSVTLIQLILTFNIMSPYDDSICLCLLGIWGVVLLIDLFFCSLCLLSVNILFKNYKHTRVRVKPPSLSRTVSQLSARGCWLIRSRAPQAGLHRVGGSGGNVHFLLLPPPFQEEITVSWIINENKLANIKYWKGNVCMLTIKMANEALTCLRERACQPNASPPAYLQFHNTKKKESSLPVLSIVLINN